MLSALVVSEAGAHGTQVAPGLLQALRALLQLRGAAPLPRARSQLAAMLDAALAKLARSLTALLGEASGPCSRTRHGKPTMLHSCVLRHAAARLLHASQQVLHGQAKPSQVV